MLKKDSEILEKVQIRLTKAHSCTEIFNVLSEIGQTEIG